MSGDVDFDYVEGYDRMWKAHKDANEALVRVARERDDLGLALLNLPVLWACPAGHVSSVTRLPNAQGARRCFFCGASVQQAPIGGGA